MRIAVVTHVLSTNGGGLASVSKGQAEGFLANGDEVHVFGVGDDLWREEESRWPAGHVTAFPIAARHVRAMTAALVAWRPDVIHVNGLWSYHIYAARRAAKKLNVPYVVAPHGSLAPTALSYSRAKKAVARLLYHDRCLNDAAAMLASSEGEAADFRAFGLKQRVEIVGNGIDTDGLVDRKPREDGTRKQVLSLGRLHPIKGLDLLIRAWAGIEPDFPDWDLVIAGPDSYGHRAELEAIVADHRLSHVQFPGAVYTEQKFRMYAEADIFALPSRADNFALTVIEALMSETPVLAAHTTPWAELDRQDCGWWVDLEHLGEALRDAMSLPEVRRREMGAKGRSWAEEHFTWPRVAERLNTIYTDLRNGSAT